MKIVSITKASFILKKRAERGLFIKSEPILSLPCNDHSASWNDVSLSAGQIPLWCYGTRMSEEVSWMHLFFYHEEEESKLCRNDL